MQINKMLPAVDVKHKLQNNIPSACRRKNDGRSQRPTALVMCRNRSESPANRSKSRPRDPASDKWQDMSFIQEEMEKKSGFLTFGCESIKAKMEEFEHEALLGYGTCSVVYKMRHRFRPDIVIAVKNMRRSSDDQENKRILMDLHVVTKSSDCAYIVECFGIFLTTSDVWICMEVMSTSLDKLLHDLHRPFPEKVLGKITYSIITALDYLKRNHNVMHRDVKPSNMLLSYQGVVKLCDFGISGKLKDSIARSRQLGCIGYMAPERLSTPAYDVRADIWSLGISLLELATGSFPYTGTEIEFAIMSKIISDPAPSLPHHIPFTKAFRQFVDQCLQKDYHQRPKYSFLMETEFFSRHASEPHDVLDWLRAIPLPHLQPPENHSPPGRRRSVTPHFGNSSATPRTSSPTSAATLSPDRVRAFIGAHSPSDSLDDLEATGGDNRGETLLNVTLVSAPTNTSNNNNSSEYYHHHSSVSSPNDSLAPSVHGDVSGGGGVTSSQPSPPTSYRSANGDSEKSGASILVSAGSVKCSDEPSSQASSGYGSSDSSPGAFSVDSRLQNSSASYGPNGKAALPRHMMAAHPPSTCTTPPPGPRSQATLPPASLVAPGLQKPVVTVVQQHPGKATLTQPQTTRLGSLTVTSLVGPLVQAFEQASLVCPAGDRSRHQTNAKGDTDSQPASNPYSSRRPGVQLSSSQQTARSASASTRLQRSHAQRWPASRSPAVRRKTAQQQCGQLPVSDLRCRCSPPPTTESAIREASRVGAATGQHDFRSSTSLGMRIMTPPLTGQTPRCSDNLQYDSLPRPTKSSDYCVGSGGQSVMATMTVPSCRLMQRLNTHPLPRQATLPSGGSSHPAVRDPSRDCKIPPSKPPHCGGVGVSRLPPSGCNRVPGNSQVTQESEAPMVDGVIRGKHSVNGHRTAGRLRSIIPTTNTCSHRSISQPPILHSERIPFETEL